MIGGVYEVNENSLFISAAYNLHTFTKNNEGNGRDYRERRRNISRDILFESSKKSKKEIYSYLLDELTESDLSVYFTSSNIRKIIRDKQTRKRLIICEIFNSGINVKDVCALICDYVIKSGVSPLI